MCEGRGGRDRRVPQREFVRGMARRREVDLECRVSPGARLPERGARGGQGRCERGCG